MDLRKGTSSLAGAAVWAAFYNAFWGIAWLAFMRREWTDAASSSGHLVPWTRDFWALWIAVTFLFGIGVTGYVMGASQRHNPLRAAVAASLVIWVPGTVGMAVGVGFSVHIIVLDSVVNLLAVLLASAFVAYAIASWQRVTVVVDTREGGSRSRVCSLKTFPDLPSNQCRKWRDT